MMTKIDYVLDRITMYRLVLYVLIGLIGIAAVLAYFKLLPFSPLSLLASTLFLVIMCWAMNTIFAHIFDVPTNIESVYITALILALIIDPAQSLGTFQFLGWVAILAMSSKYVLALYKKHLFNPAAIAVVITSFVLRDSASWWIGTASMLPFVLIGGLLVIRKLRQEDMVWSFCIAALVSVCIITFVQRRAISTEVYQLLVESPLFFFASIMLTEPLTAPPTKNLRRLYGILTGILIIPQIHVGPIYSTPELALVAGNVFSYLVSPKYKVMLKLRKKIKMAPNIVDFVFTPSRKLAFTPGQYMKFTLAHLHPDRKGIEIVYQDGVSVAGAKLGVKTLYTLNDIAAVPRNWPGFVGRISEQMILQIAPDYQERTFYLSGPPEMVRAYEQVLKNMNVKNDRIKKDFFPGLV